MEMRRGKEQPLETEIRVDQHRVSRERGVSGGRQYTVGACLLTVDVLGGSAYD